MYQLNVKAVIYLCSLYAFLDVDKWFLTFLHMLQVVHMCCHTCSGTGWIKLCIDILSSAPVGHHGISLSCHRTWTAYLAAIHPHYNLWTYCRGIMTVTYIAMFCVMSLSPGGRCRLQCVQWGWSLHMLGLTLWQVITKLFYIVVPQTSSYHKRVTFLSTSDDKLCYYVVSIFQLPKQITLSHSK